MVNIVCCTNLEGQPYAYNEMEPTIESSRKYICDQVNGHSLADIEALLELPTREEARN